MRASVCVGVSKKYVFKHVVCVARRIMICEQEQQRKKKKRNTVMNIEECGRDRRLGEKAKSRVGASGAHACDVCRSEQEIPYTVLVSIDVQGCGRRLGEKALGHVGACDAQTRDVCSETHNDM